MLLTAHVVIMTYLKLITIVRIVILIIILAFKFVSHYERFMSRCIYVLNKNESNIISSNMESNIISSNMESF
jgi:hypothetical protein